MGAEQVKQPASPIDFFAVNVRQPTTQAQARQQFNTQRKASAVYDGSFAIDDEKTADGSTIIGSTGTGTLCDATGGSWSGYSPRGRLATPTAPRPMRAS